MAVFLKRGAAGSSVVTLKSSVLSAARAARWRGSAGVHAGWAAALQAARA